MLEDALDGQGYCSGSVKAAGLAATAAVRERKPQSVAMHRSGGLDGEAGQWDMGGCEKLHGHLQCSEGMVQQDSQDPERTVKRDILTFMFNNQSTICYSWQTLVTINW